jgi:hypothetical protein
LLPRFPFGSDFTSTEQRLLPALALLRASSSRRLAAIAAHGFVATPSPEVRDCLDRMALARPAGLKERFYALLLRGALARAA